MRLYGFAPCNTVTEACPDCKAFFTSPNSQIAWYISLGYRNLGVGHRPGAVVANGGSPMAHILLFDDDRELREVVRTILEEAGHVVNDAANGDAGVQMYRRSPADVVI